MVSLLVKAQTPEGEENRAAPPTVACSLVHAIPGRVRFRVPRLGCDPQYAQRLQRLIESDATVTGVRASSAAASITVNYDTKLVKDAQMHAHLVRLIQDAGGENLAERQIASCALSETEKPGLFTASETAVVVLGGPLGMPVRGIAMGATVAAAGLQVAKRAFESM